MLWFRQRVLRLRASADGRTERGATAVEYGLIVALFALGMLGVVGALRSSLNASYSASESRVGAPQSQLAAPSITIDYSIVGTCASNGGLFYDPLAGKCDTTKTACTADQWPDPTTQTCVASQKTTCNASSNGWLVSTNTCESCTMDQPYDSGTGTCNATSTNCSGGRIFDGSSCVITNPGAPTGVTAARGNGQVTLGWTAPSSNGGSAITGYLVECKKSTDASWTSYGSFAAPPATVTGLANGTTYTCQVKAQNAAGSSDAAASSSFVPATTPSAPGSPVKSSATKTSVTLTFTAPGSTGGAAITGYTITRSTSASGPFTDPVAVTSSPATISGLTAKTTYYFKVNATNAVGTGPDSSASAAIKTN